MIGSHVLVIFLLKSCVYSNIWNEQMHLFINSIWFKTSVEQGLKDQYIQNWQSDIRKSPKGQMYNILKSEFGSENIFIYCLKNVEQYFFRFRTANHYRLIGTGRGCGILKF